ncbi:hypothetical protein H4F44_26500, partial [Escherichia coli]|nr:hypothetical protein [Escherichia coli]
LDERSNFVDEIKNRTADGSEKDESLSHDVSRSEKPLETLHPLRDEGIPQGRLMMLLSCPSSALMLIV